jgi:hypothetical protein
MPSKAVPGFPLPSGKGGSKKLKGWATGYMVKAMPICEKSDMVGILMGWRQAPE